MATSKQIEQPPPYTTITVGVTVLASAVALYFQFPVFIITFIGVLVASVLSRSPVLTGAKDPQTQYPTVGNPGEQNAVNRHRFWKSVPRKLFSFGPFWPLSTNMVAALGAGMLVFTLPYEGAGYLLRLIDATEALVAAPWVDALLAVIIVAGFGAALRAKDPDNGDMPATEIVAFVKQAIAGSPQKLAALVIASGSSLLIGFGAAWWISAAQWYLIWPGAVAALGLALITFAGIAHAATVRETRKQWRELCEARSMWAGRWPSMPKLKDYPQLIRHRRLGTHQEVWVDEFLAPAMQGAKYWIEKPVPEGIAQLMPANSLVAFLSVPDVAGDGSPITLSRSATRFRVITWNGDHPLNVTDPRVDRGLLSAWLDLKVSASCAQAWGSAFSLIPLNAPEPLHVEQQEWDGTETAAWRIEYGVLPGVNLTDSMPECVSSAQLALGQEVEVLPINHEMYIGAIRSKTTKLRDASILDQLKAEQESIIWEKRWKDITGPGMQAPTYFPDHDAEVQLDARTTIHSRLFGAPRGMSAKDYFLKATPDRLQSGLQGAAWSTACFYVDQQSKKRTSHLMRIVWSEQQIPLNPTLIAPSDSNLANQLAITGAVNAAFLSAKLPRPEVMSVKPLTSRQGRGHIWEVTLGLFDGMTMATVRGKQDELRGALEGCEWLRVGTSQRGCKILFGSKPSPRRNWVNRDAEKVAQQLDWEQSFLDSKVRNLRQETPQLLDVTSLPKNDLVREYRFKMPAGLGIDDVRKETGKLMSTTGNGFLDIRQGENPSEMVIMAAELSPMPTLALFDWDEIAGSDAIPFATNIQGEPTVYNPLIDSHIVVLGGPGSGKSAMLQSVLTPAAILGYELHIFDKPKGAADFQYLVPYANQVATEYVTIATALENIYREVERRVELNKKYATARVRELPADVRPRHLIVTIDEFTSTIRPELMDKITGEETEDQLREREIALRTNQYKGRIGAAVGKIMREARSAGVTMVVSGQTLSADEMKASPALGNIKNQSAVILLGKASYGQRASAFKNPELAPELGENVPKGRGIFESAEAAPIMFQSWYGADFRLEGDNAGALHLQMMTEHISAVRQPESKQLFDDDLRPQLAEIRTFGEILETGPRGEGGELVIDLGEIDLDFGDFDLGIETESAMPKSETDPSSVAEGVPALEQELGELQFEQQETLTPFSVPRNPEPAITSPPPVAAPVEPAHELFAAMPGAEAPRSAVAPAPQQNEPSEPESNHRQTRLPSAVPAPGEMFARPVLQRPSMAEDLFG